MRILAMAIVTIGTLSSVGPARAQTYDPAFPYCMHVSEPGGGPYEDCSYYTLDQCRASASGRGFSCDPNPYYGGMTALQGRHERRYRRGY